MERIVIDPDGPGKAELEVDWPREPSGLRISA